jgi:hypothetical protein
VFATVKVLLFSHFCFEVKNKVWATKLIKSQTALEVFHEKEMQKDVKKSNTKSRQSKTEVVFKRN